jgi:hypothetical protein
MQLRQAVSLYFARFCPITLKWLIIRRRDDTVRTQFDAQQDATDYARLRGEYDLERQGPRRKTDPPPPFRAVKEEEAAAPLRKGTVDGD